MRIFVIGTRGIPNILGGVETHCEELFPRIAAKGYDTTVICRSNYVKESLESYLGVKVITVKSPKKKSLEAIIHTFRAILKAKRGNADILHIHAIGPAILTPFARLLGLKIVFTHHGPDYDRNKWGKLAKFMLKLGERMGCIFANEVIVISEVINQLIKQKHNRQDAHLIYNGVSSPNFINSTDYLSSLGLEPQKYIFAMGRFVPEKNFHQLINSYSRIKNKEYKLVLAGDADFEDTYSKRLKKIAKKEGVILTGFIKGDKLNELLTHAKLFILPSSHEGLPIALLEAMSYKLPVIVSDIPANLEVGLNDNCYFPVDNEYELTKKIDSFLTKECIDLDYIMDKYNWDFISDQVIAVYKKII